MELFRGVDRIRYMQIYIDHKLQTLDADAGSLDDALAKFDGGDHYLLELAKDRRSHLSLLRSDGELFVEVWSSGNMIGMLATWPDAVQSARDFLECKIEDLPYDDDCPLCQAMRDGKL